IASDRINAATRRRGVGRGACVGQPGLGIDYPLGRGVVSVVHTSTCIFLREVGVCQATVAGIEVEAANSAYFDSCAGILRWLADRHPLPVRVWGLGQDDATPSPASASAARRESEVGQPVAIRARPASLH